MQEKDGGCKRHKSPNIENRLQKGRRDSFLDGRGPRENFKELELASRDAKVVLQQPGATEKTALFLEYALWQ